MLTNFHTHTVFCDGKSTAEEVVRSAIEKGFTALGFSGHGPTPYDESYCIRDLEGYRAEVLRLKAAYEKDVEIYLGIEEDMLAPADRSVYDYIIGSSHYLQAAGRRYPIDSSRQCLLECLQAMDGDAIRFAECYYQSFCAYILERKPDIIGHFDLITKFDEMDTPIFLGDPAYEAVAEKYLTEAAKSGCIFEVNTGAISRGVRKSPYPSGRLLHTLKKLNAKLILSSDSHHADTLDCAFAETTALLRDVGYRKLMTLKQGKFVEYEL